METYWINRSALASALALAVASAGCGEFVRESQSPSQLVIMSLQAASGAEPAELGTTLRSDVITNRTTPDPCSATSPCPTVFNDMGQVSMRLQLRDPGQPAAPTTPSPINEVTITRYRVEFRRTDGHNVPGVDVPFDFDSAATFTIPAGQSVSHGFQIVRHTAKQEAPLRALISNSTIISTIATVTFYGRDQAGNDVAIAGTIGIDFGNFGDPS